MANDYDRREFMKMAGLGATGLGAAMAMSGMGFASNSGAISLSSIKQDELTADVLVIGGGIAGCFAAIKAAENGASVILVEKGYVSKSGLSPFAGDTIVFNPDWGHDLNAWMEQVNVVGEYLNNREWCEIIFKESYARFKDMVEWGVRFTYKDGKVVSFPHPMRDADYPDKDKFPRLVNEVVNWDHKHLNVMRKVALELGVKIVDRTMIHELIKEDGRIAGAVGVPMEKSELKVFKAKAVVMSAGGSSFKPLGYPAHEITGDGHCMAYRVGAEMSSKEFIEASEPIMGRTGPDGKWRTTYESFSNMAAPPSGERSITWLMNAYGDKVPKRGMAWHGWLDAHYEAHQGRAPLFPIRNGEASNNSVTGPGAYGGMHGHAIGGIHPVDTTCASNIPGLYAAGDNISTNFIGAIYSGFGFASCHASVTGARAGVNAAEYAKNTKDISLSKNRISQVKQIVFNPIERQGGFTPKWTTHVLQSYLMPYYVMYIKHKDRLEPALKQIEFLRDHIAPKLIARDSHELRLANETKNMIMNAEMKLRSSLFREESRGIHYREDFPQRDDSNWLAWVVVKDKNGKMETSKDPIPKEWWPDQSMPYNKRYPLEFPKA